MSVKPVVVIRAVLAPSALKQACWLRTVMPWAKLDLGAGVGRSCSSTTRIAVATLIITQGHRRYAAWFKVDRRQRKLLPVETSKLSKPFGHRT